MLTLWNLGDDELETLSEGAHVRVERVLAKAHRGGALQLHSMRNSTYDVLAAFAPPEVAAAAGYRPRRHLSLADVARFARFSATHQLSNVDTVGVVVALEHDTSTSGANRSVYLADLESPFILRIEGDASTPGWTEACCTPPPPRSPPRSIATNSPPPPQQPHARGRSHLLSMSCVGDVWALANLEVSVSSTQAV
jgi:hypothetical protein